MNGARHVEVLHGPNLGMLGKRNPEHYGTLTLNDLEQQVSNYGHKLGIEVTFFQTEYEGRFIERLHALRELVNGLIVNAGAWTHYSWAIHDALEITELPAVEVHLSDVKKREPWRALSVVEDLCFATVSGKGIEGYFEALDLLAVKMADE